MLLIFVRRSLHFTTEVVLGSARASLHSLPALPTMCIHLHIAKQMFLKDHQLWPHILRTRMHAPAQCSAEFCEA